MTPDLLNAALDYARRGWAVFPCHTPTPAGGCSCGKSECKNIGKHPRTANGLLNATTDEATIRRWWEKWPDANIGLATGGESGFVALDLDGPEALQSLNGKHLPLSPAALSREHHEHRYFAYPGPCRSFARKLPGLDFRGDGGYVVAPPSLHVSGSRYEWADNLFPDDVDLAPCPDWLIELSKNGKRKVHGLANASIDALTQPQSADPLPDVIPEGARNTTLASLAGSMRRRGATVESINAALQVENERRCSPPLDPDTVQGIAESVGRYEPGDGSPIDEAPDVPDPLSEPANRLFTLSDLLAGELEPVRWTVENLVPADGITVLGGDAGVGKSWLAYHLGMCVAAGIPFLGKFPTTQASVLVFDAEGGEGLVRRRTLKLFGGLILDNSLPSDLPLRVFLGTASVDTPNQTARLIEYLNRESIGLVIVDPLIHSLPTGANENDSGSMAKFFEAIRSVQAETGATFVFTHHSRKRSAMNPNDAGQMLRGSSAIRGVLDSHLFLRKLKPGILLAEHDKSRHAEAVANFLVEITDPDEGSTTVCYGGEAEAASDQTAIATALIMRVLTDAGGTLARQDILEYAKAENLSQRTVIRALSEGVDSKILTKTRAGNSVVYQLCNQGELWPE